MELTIGWLAQGKMRLKRGDAPPQTLESRFGESIRERAVRSQQRHAWKTQGESEKFLAGAMLWGRAPKDPLAIPLRITSLCRGAASGQMLYSLETDDLCALLSVEKFGTEERRLWNKNDKRLSHLDIAADGAVACSVRHPFGTANLAVRLTDASGFGEVTEGDSYDSAPRWVPGPGRRLVFQSAGVGRDSAGQFAGLGPFSVQLLDLDRGDLTPLVEDPRHDLLTPRMLADGTLLFIRRPYDSGRNVHPLRVLKDIVLFPFRLIHAIYHYLQFFSLRYAGKKLTTADGARSREMDVKEMLIWGNRVSAAQAKSGDPEAPDLVPNSWHLIQRNTQGEERVLAKGVLAFDLAPDDSVVYSNGSAIYVRDPAGNTRRVAVETMIEQVTVLRAGGA